MVSAIQDLKSLFECRNIKSRLIYPFIPLFIEPLIKCVKGSKTVNRIFTKNETAMIKWNHVFNLDTKQWTNISDVLLKQQMIVYYYGYNLE